MNHKASKAKGIAWLVGACLVGAAFAWGMSPLVRAIPWSWEAGLASWLQSDAQGKACPANPQAKALLQRLVARLYPLEENDKAFSIDVNVVQSPVVNAYAQLGGHITLNSALLHQAHSPEEVAGVLAHEMGHVQKRHILEGVLVRLLTTQGINMIFGGSGIDWARYFLTMRFTRVQEGEADEAGLIRLQKAHIDNTGFKQFFERMEASGAQSIFLSDHPSNDDRIAMAGSFANHDVTPVMTGDEWNLLKNYCGK